VESELHRQLKAWAVDALRSSGCCAAATEVACPLHRSRVDAAGYLDARVTQRVARPPGASAAGQQVAPVHALQTPAGLPPLPLERGGEPRSVVIEVKVSLADLRSDAGHPGLLRARSALLARRLLEVREQYVRPLEPHLRRAGETLFEETDGWDYQHSQLLSHRLLTGALNRAVVAQRTQAKLALMADYQLASWLYVLSPGPGVHAECLRPHDIPPGWGLLHADAQGTISLQRPAPLLAAPSTRVQRLLRNIAVALTRRETGPGRLRD
jgi:hypothetical protein